SDLSTGLSLVGIQVMLAIGLMLVVGGSGQISLGQAGFYGIGAYAAAGPLTHQRFSLDQPMAVLSYYLAAAVCLAVILAGVGIIVGLIRLSHRIAAGFPPVLFCGLVIWATADLAMSAGIG